jgi:hypothetical protein
MKVTRRFVLRGFGGVALALPLLEGVSLEVARGLALGRAPASGTSFAIFFRQANGVACEQDNHLGGTEPERFWPAATGMLTPDTMRGRAVDELLDYRDKLLVVGGVNMNEYDFGDGHARGAMQGLTGCGPLAGAAGGSSEAAGMSLDHRIGAELNPAGRESLFLYSGQDGGWLGGACISYRAPGQRRAAFSHPKAAYDSITQGASNATPLAVQKQLAARKKSINDLVRTQMLRLLSSNALSGADRSRLQLHFDSIRDLEVSSGCKLDASGAQLLDNADQLVDSNDGDNIWEVTRMHMDVAALAIACGQTRSVAIQVGDGNDGSGRYRDPDTGDLMENYHYISHRRSSHDESGAPIPNADVLHHKIDRQFAQAFKHLLDRLSAYSMPEGNSLLEHGTAVWYNDLGNGPSHSARSTPVIIAGGASGYLKQGLYVQLTDELNHNQVLNTLGAAVGLRNAQGAPLDDFGDPDLPNGRRSELIA